MSTRRRSRPCAPVLWLALFGVAVTAVTAQSSGASSQKYPDVVAVRVRASAPGRFDFDVTVSSPYETSNRYADAFRVSSKGGAVFGERRLLHDHADEQPFTRDLRGVIVPAGVHEVVVQARDSTFGYGGASVEVSLPGRN